MPVRWLLSVVSRTVRDVLEVELLRRKIPTLPGGRKLHIISIFQERFVFIVRSHCEGEGKENVHVAHMDSKVSQNWKEKTGERNNLLKRVGPRSK
jgi:hypothetical protein